MYNILMHIYIYTVHTHIYVVPTNERSLWFCDIVTSRSSFESKKVKKN